MRTRRNLVEDPSGVWSCRRSAPCQKGKASRPPCPRDEDGLRIGRPRAGELHVPLPWLPDEHVLRELAHASALEQAGDQAAARFIWSRLKSEGIFMGYAGWSRPDGSGGAYPGWQAVAAARAEIAASDPPAAVPDPPQPCLRPPASGAQASSPPPSAFAAALPGLAAPASGAPAADPAEATVVEP